MSILSVNNIIKNVYLTILYLSKKWNSKFVYKNKNDYDLF